MEIESWEKDDTPVLKSEEEIKDMYTLKNGLDENCHTEPLVEPEEEEGNPFQSYLDKYSYRHNDDGIEIEITLSKLQQLRDRHPDLYRRFICQLFNIPYLFLNKELPDPPANKFLIHWPKAINGCASIVDSFNRISVFMALTRYFLDKYAFGNWLYCDFTKNVLVILLYSKIETTIGKKEIHLYREWISVFLDQKNPISELNLACPRRVGKTAILQAFMFASLLSTPRDFYNKQQLHVMSTIRKEYAKLSGTDLINNVHELANEFSNNHDKPHKYWAHKMSGDALFFMIRNIHDPSQEKNPLYAIAAHPDAFRSLGPIYVEVDESMYIKTSCFAAIAGYKTTGAVIIKVSSISLDISSEARNRFMCSDNTDGNLYLLRTLVCQQCIKHPATLDYCPHLLNNGVPTKSRSDVHYDLLNAEDKRGYRVENLALLEAHDTLFHDRILKAFRGRVVSKPDKYTTYDICVAFDPPNNSKSKCAIALGIITQKKNILAGVNWYQRDDSGDATMGLAKEASQMVKALEKIIGRRANTVIPVPETQNGHDAGRRIHEYMHSKHLNYDAGIYIPENKKYTKLPRYFNCIGVNMNPLAKKTMIRAAVDGLCDWYILDEQHAQFSCFKREVSTWPLMLETVFNQLNIVDVHSAAKDAGMASIILFANAKKCVMANNQILVR